MKSLEDRVAEKIDIDPDTGCWTWTGARSSGGYGSIKFAGRTRPAHRVVYENFVEPVGAELVLDHLCRNRACVNPDHLEPVSQSVNVQRGLSAGPRPHCNNGHELSGENVYTFPSDAGRRRCRLCHIEKGRIGREARTVREAAA